MPSGRLPSRRLLRDGLCIFVAYFALAQLSFLFVFQDVGIAAWWLPSGLSLAILARADPRRWPAFATAIFAAEMLTLFWKGYPAPVCIGWSLGDTVEPILGALLLQRFVGDRPTLGTVSEVLALNAAGLFAASTTGLAAAAVAVLFLPGARFGAAFAAWVVGDVAAVLTVGSLVLACAADPPRCPRKLTGIIEPLALFGGLGLVAHAIFSSPSSAPHFPILPYLVFPFSIWAALRFGPPGASLSYTIITAVASFHTARGAGPFAFTTLTPTERLLTVELFLLVNAVSLVLAATHRSLQDALEARDRFIALAAHELRTPLTPLALTLASLRNRLTDATPAVRAGLDIADRQLARLSRLIEDLLDTARISTGQLELQREAVDLAELAEEVCTELSLDARRAGSALTVEGGPAVVYGDRLRLAEILTNLVENAIKYGKGAPIHVTVARSLRGTVSIEVEDHGPGIPRDAQARIFDRFARLGSETHIPGLGLGLFVARSLVEAHGGRIAVRSEEGEGAIFTVELPTKGKHEDEASGH